MANSLDMIRFLGLQMQVFDYASHTDDVGIEWRKWLKSFETMVRASRISDEEWKKDLLLHYAGPNVQQLFDTLPDLPSSEMRGPLMNVDNYTPNMTSYEEAAAKLNAFFLPKENSTYERHLLRQMKQKVDESIDSFTVRLRVQAERCGFGDKVEENVKDQIIENCQSAALRRDLLKRGDADLQEVLRVSKIFETVALQEKSFTRGEMLKPQISEVNRIEVKPSYGKRNRFTDSVRVECHRCGYFGHMARDEKCPARGKSCNKCGGRDHFAKKCRKRKQLMTQRRDFVPATTDNGSDDNRNQGSNDVNQIVDTETEYVFNVTTTNNDGEVQCKIGGVAVSVVIDSGSKYNLLSESVWQQMKSSKVVVSNQTRDVFKVFKVYGGQELSVLGAFTATIKLGDRSESAEFYVVKGSGKILIGRDTATAMEILKINIAVNEIESQDKAGPLGTIKDIVIDIPIKTDVVPVIQPYRRIPIALEKLVDNKLDELLSQGVIEKVNEPSKWVSPVVVVPKGEDVRICVDMRRANEAVERENHPLPTIEDFLPDLAKAKVFSRLDVENAFHQVG
ncbi:uncharacterized protein LOC135703086 [Ochlerotatus camptorhynchus]|uniref:uncharacterized protein LOC135703086 n=1 Tax=Ochlerotatus camptorhynchus TaxID=644619 RepID=UPI0031E4177E